MFVIAIDPHRGSHAAAAVDDQEHLRTVLHLSPDPQQRQRLLSSAAEFEVSGGGEGGADEAAGEREFDVRAHAVLAIRRGAEHGRQPLLPDDVAEQRLITWLPADDATAAALARTGETAVPVSPARVRVIG